MNVEIYIHGKIEGYDVYTTAANEDPYIMTFYSADYNDQLLIIETRIVENSIYCYYTYYRKNLHTYIDKPGGYLGITLRADSFVRNVQVMYQIMDMIYSQFIIGRIISTDGQKYIVKSLNEASKTIVDMIINILSQTILTKDIVKLDESFLGNVGAGLYYNPCDNRCKDLVSEYKTSEKIIISPSSYLQRERQKAKEYREKIDFVKKEAEERLTQEIKMRQEETNMLHYRLDLVKSELTENMHEKKTLKEQIGQLQRRLIELEHTNKHVCEQANLKTELAKISEPLLHLNSLLQKLGITDPSQQIRMSNRRIDEELERRENQSYKPAKYRKLFSFEFILGSVLLLTVLIFQIMLFAKFKDYSVTQTELNSTKVRVETGSSYLQNNSNLDEREMSAPQKNSLIGETTNIDESDKPNNRGDEIPIRIHSKNEIRKHSKHSIKSPL